VQLQDASPIGDFVDTTTELPVDQSHLLSFSSAGCDPQSLHWFDSPEAWTAERALCFLGMDISMVME
jgi:hypothetical protein